MRYELSDYEWRVIRPISRAPFPVSMTGVFSTASSARNLVERFFNKIGQNTTSDLGR